MRKTPKEEPDDWCDGLTAPRNEPIQWDPKRGIDWQCPEFDCLRRVPQGERPASWLPEYSYPSDHCGGRVMDKWGYRWGQRMGELWLWLKRRRIQYSFPSADEFQASFALPSLRTEFRAQASATADMPSIS